jgi:hypothetical protein
VEKVAVRPCIRDEALLADNEIGDFAESSRLGEIRASLRLTPDRFKRITLVQPDPDDQRVAVTDPGDVPRFGRDPAGRPHVIEHSPERLGPQGGEAHRQVHIGFVSGKTVPCDQIARDLREPIAIAVAAEQRAKLIREIGTGDRGGAADAVPQAEGHHSATQHTRQIVPEARGVDRVPKQMHTGE